MKILVNGIRNTVFILFLFVVSSRESQNQSEQQENEIPGNIGIANIATGILSKDCSLSTANLDKDQDLQWYRNNIPFFNCPDEDGGGNIKQIYYYRWRVLKDHLSSGDSAYITDKLHCA